MLYSAKTTSSAISFLLASMRIMNKDFLQDLEDEVVSEPSLGKSKEGELIALFKQVITQSKSSGILNQLTVSIVES